MAGLAAHEDKILSFSNFQLIVTYIHIVTYDGSNYYETLYDLKKMVWIFRVQFHLSKILLIVAICIQMTWRRTPISRTCRHLPPWRCSVLTSAKKAAWTMPSPAATTPSSSLLWWTSIQRILRWKAYTLRLKKKNNLTYKPENMCVYLRLYIGIYFFYKVVLGTTN